MFFGEKGLNEYFIGRGRPETQSFGDKTINNFILNVSIWFGILPNAGQILLCIVTFNQYQQDGKTMGQYWGTSQNFWNSLTCGLWKSSSSLFRYKSSVTRAIISWKYSTSCFTYFKVSSHEDVVKTPSMKNVLNEIYHIAIGLMDQSESSVPNYWHGVSGWLRVTPPPSHTHTHWWELYM